MKNEEIVHRVTEEMSVLRELRLRDVNWIGHILRTNCLLKLVTGGRTEVTGRRGRRRKQLVNDTKGKRR